MRDSIRTIPWWFMGAGALTSAALIAQFFTFDFLTAWVVSLLRGTQVLWALLMAAVYLRWEERIDINLKFSFVLLFIGVTAITSQY